MRFYNYLISLNESTEKEKEIYRAVSDYYYKLKDKFKSSTTAFFKAIKQAAFDYRKDENEIRKIYQKVKSGG